MLHTQHAKTSERPYKTSSSERIPFSLLFHHFPASPWRIVKLLSQGSCNHPFTLFPWDAGSTQRAVGEGSEQSLPWKWSKDQMALSSLSLVKWNQNQLLNLEGRAAGCRGPLSLSLHGLPTLWSVKALLLGAGGCPAQVSAEWNQMRGEIQSKMLDPGEAILGQSADRLLPAWLWETYFLSHFTFHQKWGRRYAEGKRIML